MQNLQEAVKAQIRMAFAQVEYPGDWSLRGSNEGKEPFLTEQEFQGKTNWSSLDPEFIDRAPDGFASALSFFSDEAFHFYIPAYLIADIDNQLQYSDPIFHLTHGLDSTSGSQRINPRRYGERTWLDQARYKFAMFNREESSAIVAYLILKRDGDQLVDFEKQRINESLENYWYEKAGARGNL